MSELSSDYAEAVLENEDHNEAHETPDVTTENRSERESSPREKTAYALGKARAIIAEGKAAGIFQNDLADKAEKAMQYGNYSEVNAESSTALKSIVELLSQTSNPNTQSTIESLRPFIRVNLKKDGRVTSFSLEDLDDYLSDESVSDEEKEVLMKEGLYGFSFPTEQEDTDENSELPSTDIADGIIESQMNVLRATIESGELNEVDSAIQQQILNRLQSAQLAKGEWGILLKAKAIQEAGNVIPLQEEDLKAVAEQYDGALYQLETAMKEQNVSREDAEALFKEIMEGNIEGIKSNSLVQRIEGLAEKFFGDTMSNETASQIIDAADLSEAEKDHLRKSIKEGIGFTLLLALYGIVWAMGSLEK